MELKIIFAICWIMSVYFIIRYITQRKYIKQMCCSCLITTGVFGFVIKNRINGLLAGDISEQLYLYILLITVVPLFVVVLFVLGKPVFKRLLNKIIQIILKSGS